MVPLESRLNQLIRMAALELGMPSRPLSFSLTLRVH
jgi:hypothetical protein